MLPLDFIMIHCYTLREDGSMDNLQKLRLDFGLELYQEERAYNIIVQGKHGIRDKDIVLQTGVTEAMVMKQYLIDCGVEPMHILGVENDKTNTYECTLWSYENNIIPHGWRSGFMVSNQEHLPRIMIQTHKIEKKLGHAVNLFYCGPHMPDGPERDAFIKHEKESLSYSLSIDD